MGGLYVKYPRRRSTVIQKKNIFSTMKIGQQVSNMAVRILICLVELTVCQKKSQSESYPWGLKIYTSQCTLHILEVWKLWFSVIDFLIRFYKDMYSLHMCVWALSKWIFNVTGVRVNVWNCFHFHSRATTFMYCHLLSIRFQPHALHLSVSLIANSMDEL